MTHNLWFVSDLTCNSRPQRLLVIRQTVWTFRWRGLSDSFNAIICSKENTTIRKKILKTVIFSFECKKMVAKNV